MTGQKSSDETEKRPVKQQQDSRTEQVHVLQYVDMNGHGRLFGGRLISWMDEVAGTVGMRHTGCETITAAIDNLVFKQPAFLNDMIVIIGNVTYVGNSSMEVRVDAYTEDSQGMRRPINRAYFTMVAVDDSFRPAPIQYGIEIKTEMQKAEWSNAQKRIALRKQRHEEGY